MNELSRLLGLRGELRIDVVDSPALRDNVLGDPSQRPLAVYTPPGYDAEGSARYPVLYCLHGYTGDVAALVSTRPWETNVVQWIDRLVVEDRMPPAILTVVDGFTRLGGSQYLDSVHNGDYATYVLRDVVGHVDAHYRTSRARAAARSWANRRAASARSISAWRIRGHSPRSPRTAATRISATRSRAAFLPRSASSSSSTARSRRSSSTSSASRSGPINLYETMEQIAYASCYSPRARERWAIDLPWDAQTGEMRDDVFARWLAYDPCERVASSRAALERLRLRYLDCGRKDEYGLDIGARLFAKRVRALGLEVRHEEFDDDHRNVGYRYEISLPALAEALDRD